MGWNSSYDKMQVLNSVRNKKSAPQEESTYWSRKRKAPDVYHTALVIKALNF